jgi:S-adenosylmethionine hydrolase
MKAVIVSALPVARIIDISHDVPPGDISAAQYLLGRVWRHFPDRTIHVVVVDPGVGTARRAIAAEVGGHRFVAPDNGVLTPVLDQGSIVELSISHDASPTFHGRDVFAPAAVRLAKGEPLAVLGPVVTNPMRSPLPQPRREGREVVGVVVYVDRFGTLITNIPAEWARPGSRLRVNHATVPALTTFGDVNPGELVAFAGSGGTMEIAVRDGSATRKLDAGVGAEIRLI